MKYYVIFCDCGRVHFIEYEKLYNLCEDCKTYTIHICSNCGHVRRIGLDKYMNGVSWYSYLMDGKEITRTDCKRRVGWVISSFGERIIMLTGNEATWQIGGDFVDNKSLKPESVSSEYWFTIQRTVDTGKTINEIRDKDKLKDLSGYYTNIDWSRTEYKRRGLSDE